MPRRLPSKERTSGKTSLKEYFDYVDEQLKKVRNGGAVFNQNELKDIDDKYKIETYLANGLSNEEADSFIDSIKTQDRLEMKMSSTKNPDHEGGPQ